MNISKIIKSTLLVITATVFIGCGSNTSNDEFRLKKRYWDLADYQNAVRVIKYVNKDKPRPSYSSPETKPIFLKLIDQTNINVVVEDEQLGLSHRSEFASDMFDVYRKMVDAYSQIDREDKFVYPREFVDVLNFGLYLQMHYFQLGNRMLIKQADDPNSSRTKSVLRSNEETLISNYCIYLDYIKQENSLSKEALNKYVDGINEFFPLLIKTYPEANFNEMKKKSTAMLKKTDSKLIQDALNNLLLKLDSE